VTRPAPRGLPSRGAAIRFGMRAMEGAIEEVEIDPKTYEVNYQVIGDTKPIGICGSGMIDALAEMYLTGVIDQKGKIREEIKSKRIPARRERAGVRARLAGGERHQQGDRADRGGPGQPHPRQGGHLRRLRHSAEHMEMGFADVDKIFIAAVSDGTSTWSAPSPSALPDLRGPVPVPRQYLHHGRLLRLLCRPAAPRGRGHRAPDDLRGALGLASFMGRVHVRPLPAPHEPRCVPHGKTSDAEAKTWYSSRVEQPSYYRQSKRLSMHSASGQPLLFPIHCGFDWPMVLCPIASDKIMGEIANQLPERQDRVHPPGPYPAKKDVYTGILYPQLSCATCRSDHFPFF